MNLEDCWLGLADCSGQIQKHQTALDQMINQLVQERAALETRIQDHRAMLAEVIKLARAGRVTLNEVSRTQNKILITLKRHDDDLRIDRVLEEKLRGSEVRGIPPEPSISHASEDVPKEFPVLSVRKNGKPDYGPLLGLTVFGTNLRLKSQKGRKYLDLPPIKALTRCIETQLGSDALRHFPELSLHTGRLSCVTVLQLLWRAHHFAGSSPNISE